MKTPINLEENKEIFKGKFQHQISNDPKSGLIRVIDYFGISISQRYEIIEHDAETKYFNHQGEYLPKFTHVTRQRHRPWTVDNTYQVVKRDLRTGEPLKGEDEENLMVDAYDYFSEVVFKGQASQIDILKKSMDFDDINNLFNEDEDTD
ncbi:hypothetical protein ACT4R0_05095 [Ornithobacterium rhinotracheale]|uniref:hypothetical protein n=1 Tax=Ornithobacterium rhinotracheale TaxID=28251 RepID=UPI0040360B58